MKDVYAALAHKGVWNYGIRIARRKYIYTSPLESIYSTGGFSIYVDGKQIEQLFLLTSLN